MRGEWRPRGRLPSERGEPAGAAAGGGSDRLALAAWVTRRGELEPLQAAGGWLSR